MKKIFFTNLFICLLVVALLIQESDEWRRRRRRRRRRSCSPRNCRVSSWSRWSACSVICGNGTQTKTRTVTTSASCGGSCSYRLSKTRRCRGHCICPLYRYGNRCQYRYTCGSRYRCRKLRPRYYNYGQCFLRYRFTSSIAICPASHFAHQCHCRNGCHPSTLIFGKVCMCHCGGSAVGAVCCAHSRYIRSG